MPAADTADIQYKVMRHNFQCRYDGHTLKAQGILLKRFPASANIFLIGLVDFLLYI